jgi:TRAP-type C4-dicarboxylate transport system permease small subunit
MTGHRVLLWVLGMLSGTMLLAMAGITVADVAGRAAFNRPVPAAYELVQVAQAILVFAALPLATRARMHITMGVSLAALGARTAAVLSVVVDAVAVLFLAVFAWRLAAMAAYLTEANETLVFLQWPVGPLVAFMAVMSALSAVYLALAAVAERRGQ